MSQPMRFLFWFGLGTAANCVWTFLVFRNGWDAFVLCEGISLSLTAWQCSR